MSLELYLKEHIKKYPFMQPQDIVKFCYQAANGAEHLLKDMQMAEVCFNEEYSKVPAKPGALYERISDDVCRIHLSSWKASGMPAEWLFRMFLISASSFVREEGRLEACLDIAKNAIRKEAAGSLAEDWDAYIDGYVKSGMRLVHHSQIFRETAMPAYRIVNAGFLCILPILEAASRIRQDKAVKTIVLDGRAAAGKSTRTEMLKQILEAEVIHMDDFFLPPSLRSLERLEEPGGNVHYERFMEEVIPHLNEPKPFSYRRFSCGKMDYDGECSVGTKSWRIVEGSYSHHPIFGEYGDIKVFCDVDPKEQMKRIEKRNGAEMARIFEQRWIPLEERYFEVYKVFSKADVCLKNEKVFVQY